MPLTDRDRRTLIIGGVILGVLLLGFFLFNSLAGGGGEEALPPVPPVTGSPSAGTGGGSGSPSVEPTGSAQPPVFTGRDPFSIPPALAPATTIGPTGTISPSSPTGTISPSTTSPTTSSPSTPGGGSSTVKGGKTVVLLDVFEQNGEPMVDVEVDGNVFNNVGIGDRFGGGSFELRSVAGDCATFLFGDEPFTLCANSTK
jgi:hypothetical protein